MVRQRRPTIRVRRTDTTGHILFMREDLLYRLILVRWTKLAAFRNRVVAAGPDVKTAPNPRHGHSLLPRLAARASYWPWNGVSRRVDL